MTLLTNRRSASLVSLLAIAATVTVEAQGLSAGLQYPPTARGSQVDDYHGTSVADPYRWLEDTRSPATRAWIESQNHLTFGYLSTIPERDAIRRRLTEVWNYPKYAVPTKSGNRLFYFENSGLLNQSILYVRDGNRPPRVLIDPNGLSPDGTVALAATSASPNGRYMAYGVSRSGSDWREFRVRSVETGRDMQDTIRFVKFSDISWTKDNRGFFYSGYGESVSGDSMTSVNRNQRVYYHRLGTPQSSDQIIFERRDRPDWLFNAKVSEDGVFAIITIREGTDRRTRLYYVYLDNPGRPRVNAPVVRLIDRLDAEYEFVHSSGDYLLVRTNLGAPRGKLVRIDINNTQPDRWITVIPETSDALRSVTVAGEHIITSYLEDARSSVRVYGMPQFVTPRRTRGVSGPGGGEPVQIGNRAPPASAERRAQTAPGYPYIGELQLPGPGTVDVISGKPGDNELFFSFVSYLSPRAIFRHDLGRNVTAEFKAPRLSIDASGYETKQVFFNSKDGTRVPMFITMKKGLVLDGNNPAILHGYGGFNVAQTPVFSPSNLAWMEMGGIYAVANLRGGSEYGKEWHEAAILGKKQNTFDDFIAAAEYLIKERYTSTPKLAISGGSNGGLLVGAVVNQRPDLFGAALPAVGVMDMLRFHKFTIGWAWTSDYGSADDPQQFSFLHAYSPLHNIRPGVRYPATLVTTADHDDRVVPGHSFKYAAALQAAQSGPAPVLIRIQTSAGHGAGKPTTMQIEEAADRLAFLVRVLGMKPSVTQ